MGYGKITFHFIPSPQKFKEKIIQAIKIIQVSLKKFRLQNLLNETLLP